MADLVASTSQQASNFFGNFGPTLVPETRNSSENSSLRESRRHRRHLVAGFETGNEPGTPKFATDMTEQTLLASAIFLDFWVRSDFPEFERTEKNYRIQFCRIEKSLEKIGPWATLVGGSLFRGLDKYSQGPEMSSALARRRSTPDKGCSL